MVRKEKKERESNTESTPCSTSTLARYWMACPVSRGGVYDVR